MDHHTIIISDEQKQVIISALGKFSELLLGQTAGEQEASKDLLKKFVAVKGTSVGTTINNLTG
jgi:hypothetical protein